MHNVTWRYSVLGIVSVAFLGIAVWKLSSEPDSLGLTKNAPPQSTPRSQLTATASAPTFSDQPQTQDAGRKTPVLLAEMESTRNLRAFVERAKQRPSEGGLFFAQKVVGFCRDFANGLSRDPAETSTVDTHGQLSARDLAATELASRCSGFTKEDYDTWPSLQEGRQSDPLLATYKRLAIATDEVRSLKERQEDLAFYLKNAGYVVDSSVLGAVGTTPTGTFLFLDGVPYGGVSREAFDRAIAAWRLAQSRSLNAASPEQSIESLWMCQYGAGRCEGDVLSRELWDLPADSPVRREVQSIYPRLSAVLSAADVAALSAPKR
jgi:hypothetical protein